MTEVVSQSLLPDSVDQLLLCATPKEWLSEALKQQAVLLIDHANCEKKAATTALGLINRYIHQDKLLHKMSRLAREELRHFEQVLAIMKRRSIAYRPLAASRYAGELHQLIGKKDPQRLRDSLLVGALIEARSFERFRALQPLFNKQDKELADFYGSLLKSEERHFQDYIVLAYSQCSSGEESEACQQKLVELAEREKALILEPDKNFRFHSGVPAA